MGKRSQWRLQSVLTMHMCAACQLFVYSLTNLVCIAAVDNSTADIRTYAYCSNINYSYVWAV